MINPKPGYFAFPEPFQREPVCGFEYLGQFHPQRDQFGNIEKSAVIDFFAACAPKGEAIMLRLNDWVELLRIVIDLVQNGFERVNRSGITLFELSGCFNVLFRCRRERKLLVKIREPEFLFAKIQSQFAAFKHFAVTIPEQWKHHFAIVPKLPIDIEIKGMGRRDSIFQNIFPPRIPGIRSHVVWYHIQQQSQTALAKLGCEPLEFFRRFFVPHSAFCIRFAFCI